MVIGVIPGHPSTMLWSSSLVILINLKSIDMHIIVRTTRFTENGTEAQRGSLQLLICRAARLDFGFSAYWEAAAPSW